MIMMSSLKQVLLFGVGFVLALGVYHFINTKNTDLTFSNWPSQYYNAINDTDQPIVTSVNQPPGYDYFEFVLQWPGAFCNIQRNRPIPRPPRPAPRQCNPTHPLPKHQDRFTVHGLWPQLNGAESPLFCTTTQTMQYRYLQAVRNDLLDYWPDLFDAQNLPNPPYFWQYEWKKHGTCSSNRFNPQQYLQITLDLAKKYAKPIFDELKKKGITPHATTPYKASSILKAVKDVTKHDAMLNMQLNDLGEHLLVEIKLCVQQDGITLFDCDPSYRFALP